MYTLRRISGQGVQMNHALGQSYTLITHAENSEDFRNTFRLMFQRDYGKDEDDQVYAFVTGLEGQYVQALYKKQQNYIMTETGSTFSNLTFKG